MKTVPFSGINPKCTDILEKKMEFHMRSQEIYSPQNIKTMGGRDTLNPLKAVLWDTNPLFIYDT